MSYRYWKADAKTSAKIIELMESWQAIVNRGNALAKEYGAKAAYTGSNGFSDRSVLGFAFDDESKVDKKLFCRLKNTRDGWRPRGNTPLAKQLKEMHSFFIAEICELIGMQQFGGASGISFRTPGIHPSGKVVYLVTPDDVTAKGCKRITDIQYEKATKEKKSRRPAEDS